jgi:HK97 family phage prohead protease
MSERAPDDIGAGPLRRGGTLDAAPFGQNGRVVRYVFSTPAVGRDMHTVAADAWQLQNFLRNPVFLWAHDAGQPPIGRVVEIGNVGDALKGTVEYPERELNPFADMVYQLVRAGYLNATSTSWQPLEWSFARDKNRPGGVDFAKVDLLEISQVPVPALPGALADARARGIDTGPLYEWAERLLDTGGMILVPRSELENLRRAAKMPTPARAGDDKAADWKVGASRDLPIEDSDSWDGPAAAKSIFEWAGGDEFDAAKARKGFLVYDSANAEKRGSYKLPIAHVVDGELKVPKGAIRAAASRLPQTDIPQSVKDSAEKVLAHYKEKAGIGEDDEKAAERALRAKHARALAQAPKVPTFRRGMYDVANLAVMLQSVDYVHDAAEFETAIEGDDSKVPAMLGEALKALGDALIAMTAEEVGELLEDIEEDGEDDDGEMRALSGTERAFIAAAKTPRRRAWRAGIAFARAGRTLSASNEKKLEDAQSHHERALKHHRAMGEAHAAQGQKIEALRALHDKADDAHDALGEHLRAAKDNPDETPAFLDRAIAQHRALGGHLDGVDETRADMADGHEDLGDSHRAMGRSVRSAQRCVRSVLDVAAPSPDEGGPDDGDDAEKQRSRDFRRRQAEKLALVVH